jgi:hypothetical protein
MPQRGNLDYDQIKAAARQGDGSLIQMAGAGSKTPGNVLIYDANGNAIDGGPPSGGSGTVTHTGGALTADLPVFGAGSADVTVGTKTGNTNEVMSASGSFTPGNALVTDADGNAIDGGSAPGGSSPFFAPTLYDPTGLSWSWVNQGTASVTNVSNAIFMHVAQIGSNSLNMRVKSLPTPPYTVEAIFIPAFVGTGIPSTTQECGMVLRNSSSGKIVTINVQVDAVSSSNWNSPTAFSSPNFGENSIVPRAVRIKIADDNAGNRTLGISYDFVTDWLSLIQSSTGFITPDQIGFYGSQSNNDPRQSFTLISWREY